MKILAIGAHADDVEIGCGGSLLKWAAQGHDITIYTATDSGYSAPDGTVIRKSTDAAKEALESANAIGATLITGKHSCFDLEFSEPLNTDLVKIIEDINPNTILTHWDKDTHSDHQALAKATLHAARRVENILMYQSNWYLGGDVFDGRIFVDISSTMDDKVALVKTFKSEYHRTGESWGSDIRERAAEHGRYSNCTFAEAFQPIRYVL
jgi:LmbE family N-acetylglucosaminyl deacetylase